MRQRTRYPGPGKLDPAAPGKIPGTSCSVLEQMGPRIACVQGTVTGDRVYCIRLAPDEEAVREHARS